MTCFQSETLIQRGLDGRLTAPERARLDAHLDRCPACRAAWSEARILARAADAWARPNSADDPGEDFTARVMAQVAQRPTMPVRATPPLTLAGGGPLLTLFLLALSVWAGPWVGAHLSVPTVQSLPHPAQAVIDVAALGRLASQDFAQAWAALPSFLSGSPIIGGGEGIFGGPYLWAALTAALALNGWFALRARRSHGPRKSAAR